LHARGVGFGGITPQRLPRRFGCGLGCSSQRLLRLARSLLRQFACIVGDFLLLGGGVDGRVGAALGNVCGPLIGEGLLRLGLGDALSEVLGVGGFLTPGGAFLLRLGGTDLVERPL
jgi:hypothetical protein